MAKQRSNDGRLTDSRPEDGPRESAADQRPIPGLRHLRVIYGLSEALASAAAVDEVSEAALEGLLDAVDADRASVLLFDDDGVMRFSAWRGLSDRYRAAVEGHSPWTRDESDARPITIADVSSSDLQADLRETILGEGIRALGFIPLGSAGRLLGKFMVYYDRPHEFDESELQLCQTVARHVAWAIERSQAERALRESEARFRLMADAAPVMIWMCGTDRRSTWFNTPWLRFVGRSMEEEIRDGWVENVHPDDVDRCVEGRVTAFDAREPFSIEYRLRRHDGQYRWLLDHGLPLYGADGAFAGFIGSCVDITDRKRAERALRESEERFRLATSAGRVGVWDWDVVADTVTWSDALFAMHGVAPEEFEGTVEAYAELIHPADRDRVERSILRALDGEGDYDMEFRIRRPDGEVIWIYTSATVVRDRSGAPVRMLGGTVDITEQKRAEEALRENDRRKDEFLATLSHELRNPLAPLVTMLQVMKTETLDPAARTRAFDVMERQLGHMVRLVDDLLDVSRITRGKIELRREPIELGGLLRAAVEDFEPLAEREGQKVAMHLPAEPLHLAADAVRLTQVVGNLLSNASKFTERGGEISVTLERKVGRATVRVRDTGIGIEADRLPHVFDMFSQAAGPAGRANGGLGIGLALAKTLVELHGGSVTAHSPGRGRGSEFVVDLPIETVETGSPDAPRATAGSGRSPRRVLVVDDNRDAALSLSLLLGPSGHEVHTAFDGLEALEAAARLEPHVILLDIGLPELDGYEVARRVRAQRGDDVVLIALTGWGQEADRRRSREAGFDAHLVKPPDTAELHRLIAASAVS